MILSEESANQKMLSLYRRLERNGSWAANLASRSMKGDEKAHQTLIKVNKTNERLVGELNELYKFY